MSNFTILTTDTFRRIACFESTRMPHRHARVPSATTRAARSVVSTATALLLGWLECAEARADPPTPTEDVHAVYERGRIAYDAGDYALAAAEFVRADDLVPNPRVLELALASASKTGDAVLGMRLVERADRRGLSRLAHEGRALFEDRVGSVDLACPGASACRATLDGAPLPVGSSFALVGEHAVVLDADGSIERFTVNIAPRHVTTVRPTRVLEVRVETPAPPDGLARRPERATPRKVSPAWFWTGAGVTLLAAAGTTLSGLDTLRAHAAFEDDRRNEDLAAEGRRAELRTNVFLVTTLVLAAGTAVVGVLTMSSSRADRREAIDHVTWNRRAHRD